MGRNSQRRRAEKLANKQYGDGHRRAAGSAARDVHEVLDEARLVARLGNTPRLDALVDELVARPPRAAAKAVATVLEADVARAWSLGWQPTDLARFAAREVDDRAERLLRWAVASEAASYEHLGRRAAHDWMAQLVEMDAVREWEPEDPYLVQLAPERRDAIAAALHVHAMLAWLPALPRLVPPPVEWRIDQVHRESALPRALLDKVRALHAKAESTTFEAEAEAFTAKAQELMARHRIDRAVLDAHTGWREDAIGRRIWIDNPYADAKFVLLSEIVHANGCRAVLSKGVGFATVFGFADELDGVDELFTSLLVQATAALQRAGSKTDAHGRSRTARFRRSFLLSFAYRIGERLTETVDATVAAASAETGTEIVPLLRARTEAADAAVNAMFDKSSLRPMRTAATDGEGWTAGRVFADQADLSVAAPIARESA
jgi:hypothetical protein